MDGALLVRIVHLDTVRRGAVGKRGIGRMGALVAAYDGGRARRGKTVHKGLHSGT